MKVRFAPSVVLLLALGSTVSCGSSSSNQGTPGGGDGGPSGNGGGGGKSGGGNGGGGGKSGGNAGKPGTSELPSVPGTPDDSVVTALPALPKMTNVRATAVVENVSISFDPVDGARDYRVYELPADADVSHDDQGHITVKNAVYRCAGDRQAPASTLDDDPLVQSGYIKTLVNTKVVDVPRTEADATLGYVYLTPGDGRTEVYALGDPAATGDNDCYFARWGASRSKKYTASKTEHDKLVSERWRDDGVVFYVPSAASDKTRPVHTTSDKDNTFYYVDGPEATARGAGEVAFNVLTAADGDESRALMRVFYQNFCGKSHDELVPGKAWFDRVRNQGDQQPLFDLHWSGLKQDTTLVVEALADGCPYQGFLGPVSTPAAPGGFQKKETLEAWQTLDDLHAASATGEVYINGQHDASVNPRSIARSFVKISPGPKPDMDWFEGFDTPNALGTLTDTKCGVPDNNCWQQFRDVSPTVDTSFIYVETERHGISQFLGELWSAYSDVEADVNGKFRLTPTQKASMSADTYLHATMTVDSFTTGRRYPQIMISDQDVPVQWNMENGKSLVFLNFVDWPNTYQVEVCDHKFWDVNQQCPAFDLYHVKDAADPTKVTGLAPNPEVGEHSGLDRATQFDVYASTKRVYLFLDQKPYGCAILPAAGVPSGAVTVTFGDVLYHSDADHLFSFTEQHMHYETRRHFDNLGFKSGVAEPAWDESILPCATTTIQQ